MRVLALTKYGRAAASTRQRLLQYLPVLADAGISVEYHALLDDDYVRSLATGKRMSWAKVAGSYLRRLIQMLRQDRHDLIWVYAELFPYLPAPFEKLVFRTGKPVVYDFDDAFFIPYDENPNTMLRSLLGGKLEPLLKGAAACCCGNDYLRAHASRFNGNSILLPTVVDTDFYVPRSPNTKRAPTIGWIGSPSTWPYVRPLLPVLKALCDAGDARVSVVGAGLGAARDAFDGMTLVEWGEAEELAAVQAMDIGIMPLPDEPWARGKCGYKLIQYMACGLPVVASPVGVNSAIVDPERTGLLAGTAVEWESAFLRLIASASLRTRLGEAGRAKVVAHYSLASQAPRVVELFSSVASTTKRSAAR